MRKIDRIGERHLTNEGYWVTITSNENNRNCVIVFEDGHIQQHSYDAIVRGNVRNILHRSVFGVGYIGEGSHQPRDGKQMSKKHTSWTNMLRRCYDEEALKKAPAYKGVTVCEEWFCFQNYAEWYESNYVKGWQLDKDVLIKGNKTYSPEFCRFVPRDINVLFTNSRAKRGELPVGVHKVGKKFGVSISSGNNRPYLGLHNTPMEAFQAYKTAKEQYIKEVADNWKDLIDPRVYEAMYNYKVEITD